MTSAISISSELATGNSQVCVRSHRSGFTLIELLVVIGIIILLAGILLPLVTRSYKAADRARTAADLQSISVGLEAYKSDFYDYPRPDPANLNTLRGSYTLCAALMSPDAAGVDGLDGPGFRTRAQGKPYPAYLQTDKFKIAATAAGVFPSTYQITDYVGIPILYFPAAKIKPNVTSAGYYVGSSAANLPPALFNFYDNSSTALMYFGYQPSSSATANINCQLYFEVMVGDYDCDGAVTGSEQPIDKPYLLWAAGPDGMFGPKNLTTNIATGAANFATNRAAAQKCDDITNFSR